MTYIDLWGLQKAMLRPGETQQDIKQRNAFDYAARAALLTGLVDQSRKGQAFTLSNDMINDVSNENRYGVPGGVLDLNMHGTEDGRLINENDETIPDEQNQTIIDENPNVTAIVFGVCHGANCNLERFADYAGVPVVTTGTVRITTDENGQDVGSDSYTRYDPVDENGGRRVITLKRNDYGTESWNTKIQSLGIRNEQKEPQ